MICSSEMLLHGDVLTMLMKTLLTLVHSSIGSWPSLNSTLLEMMLIPPHKTFIDE